jgi:cation-transporting ATPase 13A1
VVRIFPRLHKGEGELVPIVRLVRSGLPTETSFTYQADKYVLTLPDPTASVTSVLVSPLVTEATFRRLPYPVDAKPALAEFHASRGLASEKDVQMALNTFGPNNFNIPKPSFVDLFVEHAVAPFFVFQIFCVGLWMLDEYWYYSLFTLFMLVVFECTVVFQVSRSKGYETTVVQ